MTRELSAPPGRITRPIRVVRRPPDPATITALGFTCFRLVPSNDADLVAVPLRYSHNAMFAFVRPG